MLLSTIIRAAETQLKGLRKRNFLAYSKAVLTVILHAFYSVFYGVISIEFLTLAEIARVKCLKLWINGCGVKIWPPQGRQGYKVFSFSSGEYHYIKTVTELKKYLQTL